MLQPTNYKMYIYIHHDDIVVHSSSLHNFVMFKGHICKWDLLLPLTVFYIIYLHASLMMHVYIEIHDVIMIMQLL